MNKNKEKINCDSVVEIRLDHLIGSLILASGRSDVKIDALSMAQIMRSYAHEAKDVATSEYYLKLAQVIEAPYMDKKL